MSGRKKFFDAGNFIFAKRKRRRDFEIFNFAGILNPLNPLFQRGN